MFHEYEGYIITLDRYKSITYNWFIYKNQYIKNGCFSSILRSNSDHVHLKPITKKYYPH